MINISDMNASGAAKTGTGNISKNPKNVNSILSCACIVASCNSIAKKTIIADMRLVNTVYFETAGSLEDVNEAALIPALL